LQIADDVEEIFLFSILCPRPPRCVPDVQDYDRVLTHDSVEDLERIAHERKDAYAGPLLDARRAFRRMADLLNDVAEAQLQCCGNPIVKFLTALSGYSCADRRPRGSRIRPSSTPE
jgi:hypothetical protein